jgi:penicillin-binding protein 2
MKTFHEKWYAGEVISVGIGQGAVAASPIQMARAIAGIASGGALKRPHVVMQDQLPPTYRQAMIDSYPGSGDATVPMHPDTWEVVTDAMALVPGPGGTANSGHLEGIDFAGKTGSAQVVSNELKGRVGGGGKAMKDNAWFVGVDPRRNPDVVVCTLFEGGEHGTLAGRLAAQVIGAYVNKQRRLENNVLPVATPKPATPPGQPTAEAPEKAGDKPVEVGAIWSNAAAPDAMGGRRVKPSRPQDAKALAAIRGGHFFLSDAETRTAGGTR